VTEQITGQYLEAVDAALPGFVDGLYVVGSAALGAFQPGHSDIDAVVFASRTATESDSAALRDVHASMPSQPYFDGVYVSPADRWAADQRVVPFVMEGAFITDQPCGNLNPVLWLILQRYGIPVRGPAVPELGVQLDPDALRAYNLENLRSYWQPQAAGIRRHIAGLDSAEPVLAEYVVWVALGAARLHYTLATGDVVSKSGAGEYVIAEFPDYASLAERSIRWRAGEPVEFTAADFADAASLTDLVIDDAWARWG
jgi:hypothetical protein